MNVLVLGPIPSPVTPVLKQNGCEVIEWPGPIYIKQLQAWGIEFAVSYRYRHLVNKAVIRQLRGNIINLHISLLPWNRGADPNLWSFLEDSPKGVTIHYIDEGLDTGDIIAQKEIFFNHPGETLATTHERLNGEVVELFRQQWPLIAAGKIAGRNQPSGGSFHRRKDKKKFAHLLDKDGWGTPVGKLKGRALISFRTRGRERWKS